jgi:hypothetical protein
MTLIHLHRRQQAAIQPTVHAGSTGQKPDMLIWGSAAANREPSSTMERMAAGHDTPAFLSIVIENSGK